MKTGFAQYTDEQLVMETREAFMRGDGALGRRCAGELWFRLGPRVRLQVARRVPRDEVDDVCHLVAEQLISYVYRSAEVPHSIAAIAFNIAGWRIADRTRSAKGAPDPVAEIDLPGAEDSELAAMLDRDAAESLLGSLDARSAAVLRRTLAGEPAEAIADDLGITRSHLDVIAHRARQQLRTKLEEAR